MNYRIRDLLEGDYEYSDIIFQYLLDYKRSKLFLNLDQELSENLVERFFEIQDDLNKGRPLQYAIGKWNFYGYDFIVDERALIPRPETELLVERILKENTKDRKILDIGTGSGSIAITLDLESDLKVYASDISKDALELARQNNESLGAHVEFILSDLFENIGGKFDYIVSNPPYLTSEEYERVDELLYHEPKMALVAGYKGYEIYEKIINKACDFLNPNGLLFFEIGYKQAGPVVKMMEDQGFIDIEVIKDYGDKDRIVLGKVD